MKVIISVLQMKELKFREGSLHMNVEDLTHERFLTHTYNSRHILALCTEIYLSPTEMNHQKIITAFFKNLNISEDIFSYKAQTF